MRISTNTIYDAGVRAMQDQMTKLMQVQQQISSGRRVVTPADDPVAAARVLEVSQSQSINTQYANNTATASDGLTLEETVLGSISSVLQSVRDSVVSAGNATYNASDLKVIASELQGRYQELLGLANSTDAGGQYMFSGYQGGVQPFAETAPGKMKYNGDQGQRLIQVSPSRQIAVSDAGEDLFMRIPSGNGTFTALAANNVNTGLPNSGSGVIDAGTVLDSTKWNDPANSRDYTIKFSVSGGVTTYDVIDNKPPGNTLKSGTFAGAGSVDLSQLGIQVNIAGAPADGDTFTIKASANQDLFTTMHDLINLLQSAPSGAKLSNGLASGLTNLDNAMQNVLTVRTATGSRLKELDSVKSASDDRALAYSQTMSNLQDLDYAKAASELAQQQVNLQAAQQSFSKVAGLSLFNYL